MQVDLSGRLALVTGAGSGIGKAIALSLARNGAAVAVNDLHPTGQATAAEIVAQGVRARFYQADVGDPEAVEQMVTSVEKELGPIRILVNNAGINLGPERHPVHEFADSDWDRILRVDLYGVFHCSRAASARMVTRRAGCIINIGSVMGIIPIRVQSAFAAAKAGVHHFTRSHALEVGRYGIRVNAIAPGSTLTKENQNSWADPQRRPLLESLLSHIPLGTTADVEDIANAALYLASDDSKYVTGHVLVVDGGWTAGFAREW